LSFSFQCFYFSFILLFDAHLPLSLTTDATDTLLNPKSGINDSGGVLNNSPGDTPAMPGRSSPAMARLRRPGPQ
jgi:hypothetical protein